MTIKRISLADPAEPIALSEAITHLREIAGDAGVDALIGNLITAARAACENFTGLVLQPGTYEVRLPAFESHTFMRAPLGSLLHVKYYDATDTEQTLAAEGYELDDLSDFRTLHFLSSPATAARKDAVQIRYTLSVPAPLRQGMLLLIRMWYDNPAGMSDAKGGELPFATERLWWPYRVSVL